MMNLHNHITIIGGGDVLTRLFPALTSSGYKPADVHILSDGIRPQIMALIKGATVELFPQTPNHSGVIHALAERAVELARQGSAIIVATPTYTHLAYAQLLLKAGAKVGIEKPLICSCRQMQELESLAEKSADNIFSFSYYRLEKALPLLCFAHPSLNLPEGILSGNSAQDILDVREELGCLRSLDVLILEGKDRSPSMDSENRLWTEDPAHGGTLIETFLHNAVIAEIVVGDPSIWHNKSWMFGTYGARLARDPHILPSYIDLAAETGDCKIRLICGKHIPDQYTFRGGTLRYDNGLVIMDFDRKILTAVTDSGRSATIEIAEGLQQNYKTQVSLFKEFLSHDWQEDRWDGLKEQIAILRMLLKVQQTQYPTTLYDDNVSPDSFPGLALVEPHRLLRQQHIG